MNLTHKLAGTRAAFLALVVLLAAPNVFYYLALVKTYSLVATLTLLALALALHSGSSPSSRWALVSTGAAALAALTRLTFLSVLGLVFVYWVWRRRVRAGALCVALFAATVLV